MLLSLNCLKKVGSFFYCQLQAGWLQGKRTIVLWKIGVIYFLCVMLNNVREKRFIKVLKYLCVMLNNVGGKDP